MKRTPVSQDRSKRGSNGKVLSNQPGTDLPDFRDFQKHAKNPVLPALVHIGTNMVSHQTWARIKKLWQIVIRCNKWIHAPLQVKCHVLFFTIDRPQFLPISRNFIHANFGKMAPGFFLETPGISFSYIEVCKRYQIIYLI